MNIAKAAHLLRCDILYGGQAPEKPLVSACGADLLSDILAFGREGCILLTGTVNPHVVRTADMLDVPCIVFVRGRKPTAEMYALAEKTGIALLICDLTLYEACGILYREGLPPSTGTP